jgi:polysaccharide biosynthesis transport protein
MVYQRSFREILHVFLRRKMLFAVVFGVVGLAGGAYLQFKQPLYMANAALVLHFGGQAVPDIDRSMGPTQLEGSSDHREILYSDAAILTSPELLRSVVDNIGLGNLYPQIASADGTDAAKQSLAVKSFASNLTVDVGTQSDVININFLHPSPILARDSVRELLSRFYEQEADVYANPQLAFAASEAQKARASLTQAQNELADYKSRYNISNLSEQVSQLLTQRTDVESRWRIAQAAALQAQQQEDALTKLLQTIQEPGNSSAAGEENQAADSAEARLDELKAERSRLARTYRPGSIVLRRLDAQIHWLSRVVNPRSTQSRNGSGYKLSELYQSMRTDLLRATAQAASATQPVQVLENQLKQINNQLNSLESAQREYDNLTQAVQIHSDAYRSLALRDETARVEANRNAQRISDAVLISSPIIPTEPARPRKQLVAFAAFLAALILAGGTVLATEAFDDRFQTPADVTRVLRLPVLATFAGDAD